MKLHATTSRSMT